MNGDQETPRWVVTTDSKSFLDDIFQRSSERPVVVDFWAPWCAPCRQLGPVLEKLAAEYAGRFVLVKANTDELPQLASQFQVQSIPSVFGVIRGEAVNFFAGAMPEQQVREWLDQLLQAGRILDAERVEASDPSAAESIYREILAGAPADSGAAIGLARLLCGLQRFDEARDLIDGLEQRGFLEPEAEQLKATLSLHANASVDLEACRQAVASDPSDLAAKLKYAEALAGAERYEQALELALTLVEQDRQGMGEVARQLMVNVFRVLPSESELVNRYRRKLAMLLY